jgi:predicted amidohydrolase YtcJ
MDVLITGGVVLPIDAAPIVDGAVAIRNGRIVAVGAATAIERLIGSARRTIRLRPDQALMPGMIDSHQHLLSFVRSRTRLSFWQTTRLADLLNTVAHTAARRPAGSWIVGVGHDQGRLSEGRHPSLAELDAVAPEHPLLIYRACSHIALANSRALAVAGIDATTADPDGGRIERDAAGQATGVLLEGAMHLVSRHTTEPAIDWQSGLREAAHEYYRRGITTIGEAALGHVHGHTDLQLMQAAYQDGLRLRMFVMAYGDLAEQCQQAVEALPPGLCSAHLLDADWLQSASPYAAIGCIKHFIDGTLGGGTAFLTQPYGDEPTNYGWPIMPATELYERVERAHRLGFQLAVHAIGDAAVAMVVDAYEQALLRFPRADHRHRIEHVEVIHPGLAERMARLGIVAGIQSCFTYWESGDVTRLGPGLAPYGHAWGDLARAGVVIANGSDNPVLPDFHPLQGIHAAVNRTTYNGLSLAPHQAISTEQALTSYTSAAAYACRAETLVGRIRPGMLADLVVLSANPLAVAGECLHELQVDLTMIGGDVVWIDPKFAIGSA